MPSSNEKLVELLNSFCNETLSAAQSKELEGILMESEEARELYLDYVQIQLQMVDHARKAEFASTSDLLADLSQTESQGMPQQGTNLLAWVAFPLAFLGVAVLGLMVWLGTSPADSLNDVALSDTENVGSNTEAVAGSDSIFVAQVAGVTPDVQWGKHSAEPDFLLRVRRGDRIEIDSGFVELEYFTKARVILHGPGVFVLTGHNSGRLEKGKMTGKVDGEGFEVTTPSARIVDLGTEFGLAITDKSETEVCVLDGKVEVYTDLSDGGDSLALTEGMSARVETDGVIEQQTGMDVEEYSYSLPSIMQKAPLELSLVDLLSAKSPDRFGLAGVIAPDTGKADQSPWLKATGPGHRHSDQYKRTSWHPFVDGVFIPSRSGKGIQIDSAGAMIDLPASKGRTWGPVWSRRKFEGKSSLATYESYWGNQTMEGVNERLQRCQTGMIGIHSSVGVTFDLNAIRNTGFSPNQLTFSVENLENSMQRNPEWSKKNRFSADLRVFVDGELRAKRLDFARSDGELQMSLRITESDQFLTFVSSDCGIDGFDHVVVVDPKLLAK